MHWAHVCLAAATQIMIKRWLVGPASCDDGKEKRNEEHQKYFINYYILFMKEFLQKGDWVVLRISIWIKTSTFLRVFINCVGYYGSSFNHVKINIKRCCTRQLKCFFAHLNCNESAPENYQHNTLHSCFSRCPLISELIALLNVKVLLILGYLIVLLVLLIIIK